MEKNAYCIKILFDNLKQFRTNWLKKNEIYVLQAKFIETLTSVSIIPQYKSGLMILRYDKNKRLNFQYVVENYFVMLQ